MEERKEMKVEFVHLSKEYVDYLRDYVDMYGDYRPGRTGAPLFVKIPGKINGHTYYAPLSLPKQSDYDLVDGLFRVRESTITIHRITCPNDKTGEPELKGSLRLSHMVPAPQECVIHYDSQTCLRSSNYKELVRKEQAALETCIIAVTQKAYSLHGQKQRRQNLVESGISFDNGDYLDVTFDFQLLEELCTRYTQHIRNMEGGLRGAAAAPGGPVGAAAQMYDERKDEVDGTGGVDRQQRCGSPSGAEGPCYSLWGGPSEIFGASGGGGLLGVSYSPETGVSPLCKKLWRYGSDCGGRGDYSLWGGDNSDLSDRFNKFGMTEMDYRGAVIGGDSHSGGKFGAVGEGRNALGASAQGGDSVNINTDSDKPETLDFHDGSVRKKILESRNGKPSDKDEKSRGRHGRRRRGGGKGRRNDNKPSNTKNQGRQR